MLGACRGSQRAAAHIRADFLQQRRSRGSFPNTFPTNAVNVLYSSLGQSAFNAASTGAHQFIFTLPNLQSSALGGSTATFTSTSLAAKTTLSDWISTNSVVVDDVVWARWIDDS
ncbi:hypothetical protein BASA50_006856 [Batrachochytrium salamandrivorans]|uniref:Legume lectin domain-containing protein n=1 Tax=Batrachochytrium salamandrivorans TaxID=1357716 RepID=A0ABQ8F8R0_9FUNG|nr:hypothetical protein BASA62_008101 [Batrachochytrium salamandrivorans]KAH6572772.1 hypothetical protein BASA60_006447 [Batrachochytrium salamandrivorans]KAH6594159.1 hypothetical protein BASA50_006856 [Batrachochytrium salamandrivorans]KAH6601679.1 hypothetical protein BASA61_001883 [Batrachochytrium salamandrivorans]KAH9273095.1 hypothetical protein BASA83_004672 [Batrachochytrium salamandrivorans]